MHLHGFTRTKHSLLSATILPSSLELKALAGQILAWLPIYHLSENNSLLKQMEKFKERKAKGNPTELQHLQIKALGVLTARNAHTTTGETEQIRGGARDWKELYTNFMTHQYLAIIKIKCEEQEAPRNIHSSHSKIDCWILGGRGTVANKNQ